MVSACSTVKVSRRLTLEPTTRILACQWSVVSSSSLPRYQSIPRYRTMSLLTTPYTHTYQSLRQCTTEQYQLVAGYPATLHQRIAVPVCHEMVTERTSTTGMVIECLLEIAGFKLHQTSPLSSPVTLVLLHLVLPRTRTMVGRRFAFQLILARYWNCVGYANHCELFLG